MSMLACDLEEEEDQREWSPESVSIEPESVRSVLIGYARECAQGFLGCLVVCSEGSIAQAKPGLTASKQLALTVTGSRI